MSELSALNDLFQPRMLDEYAIHVPHPVQQVALAIEAEEMLFGGAVGGGKSDYLLMSALQYVDVPGYSALLLRRTWPDLNSSGAIVPRFREWMAGRNVKEKDQGRLWLFPSGAKIQFGYVARESDKTKFQGAEYQFIGIDEATLFEPEVYLYLMSRLRKPQIPCSICNAALTRYYVNGNVRYRHSKNSATCDYAIPDSRIVSEYPSSEKDGMTIFDIPIRIRATANPGGIGHEFFRDRFVIPNQQANDEENRKFNERVFIPSTLDDNPSLSKEEYKSRLENLSPVDRERMLNGDWEVMDAGSMFNRGQFQSVAGAPDPKDIRSKVRYWDLAASEGDKADYSVGALCSITHDGKWYIEDIIRMRELSPVVEKKMKETAQKDGINVKIYAEQEPGSSGKAYISHLKRTILAGYQFEGYRSTGSKEARAGSLASQADANNIYMVRAPWNKDFLDEADLFPNVTHDDQIDAVSGGFIQMTVSAKRKVRLVAAIHR